MSEGRSVRQDPRGGSLTENLMWGRRFHARSYHQEQPDLLCSGSAGAYNLETDIVGIAFVQEHDYGDFVVAVKDEVGRSLEEVVKNQDAEGDDQDTNSQSDDQDFQDLVERYSEDYSV